MLKAFTDYASDGVASDISVSIILADLPDQPSQPPSRNALTSENKVVCNILPVPGDHGSTIVSYHIEIDDGAGGNFVEL
jgi:hypothetical protein